MSIVNQPITNKKPLPKTELADESIRHLAGVAQNIPIKICDILVPVDFIVLDMEANKKIPLILGRPFLCTSKAHIDVGAEEIQFTINGALEKFNFKPKVEQCSMILATELATIIALTHTKKKAKSKPRAKSQANMEEKNSASAQEGFYST
jgi:hypothetical protein